MSLNKYNGGLVLKKDQGQICVSWQRKENRKNIYYWLTKKSEINAIRQSLTSEIVTGENVMLGKPKQVDGHVVPLSRSDNETSKLDFNYVICNEHSYACKHSGFGGNNQRGEVFERNDKSETNQLCTRNISSHRSCTNDVAKINRNEWIRINLEHLYCKGSQINSSVENKEGEGKKTIVLVDKIRYESSREKVHSDVSHVENSLLGNNNTNTLFEISNKNNYFVKNLDDKYVFNKNRSNHNSTSGVLCKKFVGYRLTNQDPITAVEQLLDSDRKEGSGDLITNDSRRISNSTNVLNIKENVEKCSFNFLNSIKPVKTDTPSSTKQDVMLSDSLHLENCLDSSTKKYSILSNVLLDHSYTDLPSNVVHPMLSRSSFRSHSNNYSLSVDKAVKKLRVFKNSKKRQNRTLFKITNLKSVRLKKKSFYRKNSPTLKKKKNSMFYKMGNCGSPKKWVTDMNEIDSFSNVAKIEDNKIINNENKFVGIENNKVSIPIYHKKKRTLTSLFRESADGGDKFFTPNPAEISKDRLIFNDHLRPRTGKLKNESLCIASPGDHYLIGSNYSDKCLAANEGVFSKDKNVKPTTSLQMQKISELTKFNKTCVNDSHVIELSRRRDLSKSEHNYVETNLMDKVFINTSQDENKNLISSTKCNDWNNRNNCFVSVKRLPNSSTALKHLVVKKQKIVSNLKECNVKSVKPAAENYLNVSMNEMKKFEDEEIVNNLKSSKLRILKNLVTSLTPDVKNVCRKTKIDYSPVEPVLTEVPSTSSATNIDFDEQNYMTEPEKRNDTYASNNISIPQINFLKKRCDSKVLMTGAENGSSLLNSLDIKKVISCKKKPSNVKKSKKLESRKCLKMMERSYVKNISSKYRRRLAKAKKLALADQNSYDKKNFQNFNFSNTNKYLKSTEIGSENFLSNCGDMEKIGFNKNKVSFDKLSENLLTESKPLCPVDCVVSLHRIDDKKIQKRNFVVRHNKIDDKLSSSLPKKSSHRKSFQNHSILSNSLQSDVVKSSKSKTESNNDGAGSLIGTTSNEICKPSSSTDFVNYERRSSKNLNFVVSCKSDSRVVSYKSDSLIFPSKFFFDHNSSVSKDLLLGRIDANNTICKSVSEKIPVVVISDIIKQVEFLSCFNLQPTWMIGNDRKRTKSRLCTLNKNYNEEFLMRGSSLQKCYPFHVLKSMKR